MTRSGSRDRDSPARQGVNFRENANVKTFESEAGGRVTPPITEPEPLAWVDFRKSAGGGVKGNIQGVDGPKKVERIVPITLTDGGKGAKENRNPFLETEPEQSKANDSANGEVAPIKVAPLATEEGATTESACYACDVCTQTEESGKKGCLLM